MWNEENILKIIEWAHRQHKLIQNLTEEDIIIALKTYLRQSSHF